MITLEHLDHFSYGLVTPVVAYVMASLGAALGLRCTVRALNTRGRSRSNWLVVGATAIGAGIWTMHFIAMLGFQVVGSPVRYDVLLTLLSLVVAIIVVGAGVFTVGFGRSTVMALLLGGVGMGLGVATMHYTGMAAVQVNGAIQYDGRLVALSVAIAVTAATAALWIVLYIHGLGGALGAALVMGVAVSSMHYTAMAAVDVELASGVPEVAGATAMEFLFPLAVVIGTILLISVVVIAVSPIDDVLADAEAAEQLRELAARRQRTAALLDRQLNTMANGRAGPRRTIQDRHLPAAIDEDEHPTPANEPAGHGRRRARLST